MSLTLVSPKCSFSDPKPQKIRDIPKGHLFMVQGESSLILLRTESLQNRTCAIVVGPSYSGTFRIGISMESVVQKDFGPLKFEIS